VSEEDDALHQTINHGSSIHKAGFLDDLDIYALSHDEKFAIYPMITDTEAAVEEPPSIQFGDLRERLGCEYVANVLGRPGGGGVIGIGNHRLVVSAKFIFSPRIIDPYDLKLGRHFQEALDQRNQC